jgi:hypothetical protein
VLETVTGTGRTPRAAEFKNWLRKTAVAGSSWCTEHVLGAAVLAVGLVVCTVTALLVANKALPLWSTGLLVVSSAPSSAAVYIDGRVRGVTPLAVELSAGDHDVEVRASYRHTAPFRAQVRSGGQTAHHVELPDDARSGAAAGSTARAPHPAEGVAIGWVTLPKTPRLDLFEGPRRVGSNASQRLSMSPGLHVLTLVNDDLGFRHEELVLVPQGDTVALRVDRPFVSLEIDSRPAARVTVDGVPRGTTPLTDLRVPIGPHVVQLSHPNYEVRTTRVSAALGRANRLHVELRRQTPAVSAALGTTR